MTHNPRQNASGNNDLTAYIAIKNVAREEKRIRISEADEQAALFEWAQYNMCRYPDLQCMYAIPNGGSRHPAEARNLKRQGVKPGVSDVHLPTARRGYHGLYIEMKALCGRVSAPQKEWISLMRKRDYAAVVCYGVAEAIAVLTWYLEE